jgi:acyl carrier protein
VHDTKDAVFSKLRAMLVEQLGVEEAEIRIDSTLEDLGADSLDMVEMVMAIEQEWDLEIPDEAAEMIKTVGDAVDYIVTHA